MLHQYQCQHEGTLFYYQQETGPVPTHVVEFCPVCGKNNVTPTGQTYPDPGGQHHAQATAKPSATATRARIPLTVFTVLLNQHGEVLLMRRANTGFGDGHYSLPGGHVEKHERVPDAARRETLEEVGIQLTNVRIESIIHSDVDREYLHFVAVATHQDWTGTVRNMEPDQCDHMAWYPWGDWPENMLPCIKLALENVETSTFFSEHFPQRS